MKWVPFDVMKPILRGVTILTFSTGLLLGTGCKSRNAHAEETTVLPNPAPVTTVAAVPAPAVVVTPAPQPVVPAAAPAPRAPIIITNPNPATPVVAASAPASPEPELTPPADVTLSPALGEVVKLLQAGVGEEVLSAYITNSTDVFDIGADQILYLHDLGLPSHLITALIQQDSTPEALARRQAVATVPTTPVPEAVAAQPPATTTTAPAVVYTVPAAQQPVVINQFYNDLAPYGTWVEVAGYGRCWRPTVAIHNRSWRPYADGGRWVWTDHGWYWYSDYSWGWAPFHYGRWNHHASYGWCWVPDVHWGPAWVSWRTYDSYCAWAPLPPLATFSIGIGWSYGGRRYRDECDFIPHHRYVALPIRHLHDARPSRHFIASRQVEQTVRASSAANNYTTVNQSVFNRGMPVDAVARESGRNIRPVSLRPTSDAPRHTSRREVFDADARTLTVARPTLNPSSSGNGNRPVARPAGGTTTPRVIGSRPATGTPATSGNVSTPANIRDTGTGNASSGNADSPRSPRPVTMRGTARPADTANNAVNVSGGTPSTTTVTPRSTTPTVVNPNPTTPSQPRGVRNTETTAPRGGRPATVASGDAGGRPPVNVRPSSGNSATPAPVARVPSPSARPEAPRAVAPSPSRAPVYNAPERSAPSVSSTPRVAPAPPVNNTPRPSSPAPRVESPRSPSPSPAPSRPSSSGESSPRGSRSSGDDNGRRNGR